MICVGMFPFLYGSGIKEWDFGFYRTYSWVQTSLLLAFLFVLIVDKITKVIMQIKYRNELKKTGGLILALNKIIPTQAEVITDRDKRNRGQAGNLAGKINFMVQNDPKKLDQSQRMINMRRNKIAKTSFRRFDVPDRKGISQTSVAERRTSLKTKTDEEAQVFSKKLRAKEGILKSVLAPPTFSTNSLLRKTPSPDSVGENMTQFGSGLELSEKEITPNILLKKKTSLFA